MGLEWGSGFSSFKEFLNDANAVDLRLHFEQQGPIALV